MTPSHRRGFTLIELMIAVVVAGILAAVAYPSLMSFIQRGRRADAIAALTTVVQAQERFRSNSNSYATSLGDEGLKLDGTLAKMSKYYDFTLTSAAFATGYQITARPKSSSAQAKDVKNCASLSVKLDGGKFEYLATNASNADSSSTCWPR